MVAWFISMPGFLKAELPSRFASFGDLKVHYRTVGEGDDALVFVHGWTCDSNSWRGQLSAFPDRRVIALDLPGHGKSDKPKVDYTMAFFARAIDAVLRDAKVDRAVLVGHSMGAPVVREFYRLFPGKTAALVIVDGALRPMFSAEQSKRLQEQLRADYVGMTRRMVDGMVTPVRDETLRDNIRAAMLSTPEHVGLSAMQAITDQANYGPDPIKVPMLAVLAKSPMWAPDTEQFLRSLAPDLQFRMMEGVSHFLMLEKPDELNALLRDFLATKVPLSGAAPEPSSNPQSR